MGLTCVTMQVYHGVLDEVRALVPGLRTMACSEGWVTVSVEQDECRPDQRAKWLSRQVAQPVLMTNYFDGDELSLMLYQQGKRIGSMVVPGSARNLRALCELLDLDEARLREIRRCDEFDLTVNMLEELLGISVRQVPHGAEGRDAELVPRQRGEAIYRSYLNHRRPEPRAQGCGHAVQLLELDAKASLEMLSGSPIFLTPRLKSGVYRPEFARPFVLEERALRPLLAESEVMDAWNSVWLTDDCIHSVQMSGDEEAGSTGSLWMRYVDGQRESSVEIPQGVSVVGALPGKRLLCTEDGRGSDGGTALLCLDPEGAEAWRLRVDGGLVFLREWDGCIVLMTCLIGQESGTVLYRLNDSGEVLGRRAFSGADCRWEPLALGRRWGLQLDYCENERWRSRLVILGSSLELMDEWELPERQAVNWSEACEEQSLVFGVGRSEHVLAVADLIQHTIRTIPCAAAAYPAAADVRGNVYVVRGGSQVEVYDHGLTLLARLRLRGTILCIQRAGSRIYAVTTTGDGAAWGIPETCITRLYRLEVERTGSGT